MKIIMKIVSLSQTFFRLITTYRLEISEPAKSECFKQSKNNSAGIYLLKVNNRNKERC